MDRAAKKSFDNVHYLATEGTGRQIVRLKAKQVFFRKPRRISILPPDWPGKDHGCVEAGQRSYRYASGCRRLCRRGGDHRWGRAANGVCICLDCLHRAQDRSNGDAPRPARRTSLLRLFSELHAAARHENPGRSDRSTLQLQREALGADAPVDGGIWRAGRARNTNSTGHAGDPCGDDRYHPITRQLLHESLQKARLHRVQRPHPGEQVAAHRGSARSTARGERIQAQTPRSPTQCSTNRQTSEAGVNGGAHRLSL